MPTLAEALPPALHGPETVITPIAAGMSGAGVYQVERDGRVFVLKVAANAEPFAAWRGRVRTHELAGEAGLAPRVVHVDEERRAVLTEFVTGTSFAAWFGNPAVRAEGLARLGDLVRRVHALPVPDGAEFREPREFVVTFWEGLPGRLSLPSFARAAVEGLLAETPPPPGRLVLSHNDMNPSNLLIDGLRTWLLDWDVASVNEGYYDMATLSFFLRMDEATTCQLVTARDGVPCTAVPPRLRYDQRTVGVISGVASLAAARRGGYMGTGSDAPIDDATTLDEVYGRLREGTLRLATPEGQWTFGLALLRSSAGIRGDSAGQRSPMSDACREL